MGFHVKKRTKGPEKLIPQTFQLLYSCKILLKEEEKQGGCILSLCFQQEQSEKQSAWSEDWTE